MIRRLRDRLLRLPWLLARLGPAGRGQARGVLVAWLAWERLASWRAGLRPVRPGAVLRYSLDAYAGPPTRLGDGTALRPGDRLLELHLDNQALLRLATSPGWTPWLALRLIDQDLDALARLAQHEEAGAVVATHAVTLFAAWGPRLGFEYRPLPRTWRWRLVHFFLVGLLACYHPRGWQGAASWGESGWPGELWLSTAALRRRTLGPAERLAKPGSRGVSTAHTTPS